MLRLLVSSISQSTIMVIWSAHRALLTDLSPCLDYKCEILSCFRSYLEFNDFLNYRIIFLERKKGREGGRTKEERRLGERRNGGREGRKRPRCLVQAVGCPKNLNFTFLIWRMWAWLANTSSKAAWGTSFFFPQPLANRLPWWCWQSQTLNSNSWGCGRKINISGRVWI